MGLFYNGYNWKDLVGGAVFLSRNTAKWVNVWTQLLEFRFKLFVLCGTCKMTDTAAIETCLTRINGIYLYIFFNVEWYLKQTQNGMQLYTWTNNWDPKQVEERYRNMKTNFIPSLRTDGGQGEGQHLPLLVPERSKMEYVKVLSRVWFFYNNITQLK